MEKVVNQERTPGPFEKRIHEIDFIRGCLILLVIFDHIMNNLMTFGKNWFGESSGLYQFFHMYWTGALTQGGPLVFDVRHYIQPMALMAFVLLSGISCAFSKNNWKRAIQTLIAWAVIAVLTNVLQIMSTNFGWGMTTRIDFNIIGVLAFSMLFYCLIQKRSNKALIAGILVALLIYFYVMPNCKENLIRICGGDLINKAGHDFEVPYFYFPFFWQPPSHWPGWTYQADYVSLFPYLAFFFAGALLARYIYKEKKSLLPKHESERPVCFIGRHTFLIYLGHLPIIWGIFYGIDAIVKAL